MTEYITTSDHIRVSPYTHAAFAKGAAVILSAGALIGFADHAAAVNAAVEIDIGVCRSVFRVPTADVAGTKTVGNSIYITSAGALTMDATNNYRIGVVIDIDSAVSFVKTG